MPPTYHNLSKQELKTLHPFSRNKNLTIKKADKGSCIVIEDTTNYNVLSHLQDASIYRQLLVDPTEHMSKSIRCFIDDLYFQNYIDKHTHSILKPLSKYP